MSPTEQQQEFVRLMKESEAQTGYTVVATLVPERLGEAIIVKPVLQLVPIGGWQLPEPLQAET